MKTANAQELIVRTADSGGAVFDRTGRYRYLLWRDFVQGDGTVVLIMLNPNNADETKNDPTVRRCINFAQSWGFGRLEVVNLFAARAPKPHMLTNMREPIGKNNDAILMERTRDAALVVVAWGNHGQLLGRADEVVSNLQDAHQLKCFGITKTGMPRHPLYVRSDTAILNYAIGS